MACRSCARERQECFRILANASRNEWANAPTRVKAVLLTAPDPTLSQPSPSPSTPSVASSVFEKKGQTSGEWSRKGSTYSEKSTQSNALPESSNGEIAPGVVVPPPAVVDAPAAVAGPVVCLSTNAASTSRDIPKQDLPKGIYKASYLTVGFAPVKRKKQYYVVLSRRAFELHDTEKAFKKGQTAKHLVDLATAFNVHLDHYDTKLKRCLCLMGPDETIVMRGDTEELTKQWYEAILNSLLPSRQLKLGRPTVAYEIFEAVYDVEVVPHMKSASRYRKERFEDGYTNICETMKDLCGMKRLCFYSHTVVLANRRIEPTTIGCPDSGFPPFRADALVEFPRPLIAFFGVQDKYFYLRLGKGVAIGGTELLVQCENEEVAKAIHEKMKAIIVREAGRRQNMTLPSTLASFLSGRHRDRSHTHSEHNESSEKTQPRPRRASNTIKLVREEPGLQEALLAARCPKKLSMQSERRDSDFADNVRKYSGSMSERGFISRNHCGSTSSLSKVKNMAKSPSVYSTVVNSNEDKYPSRDELTRLIHEDVNENEVKTTKPAPTSANLQIPCNIDQNYSKMDPTDWNYSKQPHLNVTPPYNMPKQESYNHEDVRSYVSDSTDSCYSSMMTNSNMLLSNNHSHPQISKGNLTNDNTQRANSFGGKCSEEKPRKSILSAVRKRDKEKEKEKSEAATRTSTDDPSQDGCSSNQLNLPAEDPRKRAFSLGSKNIFNLIGLNEFRKLVKKPKPFGGRPSSPNHSSTSGMSLNSSTASPSSCSATHLASLDIHVDSRMRSGSFGSGRSSPFGRNNYHHSLSSRDSDHHVEIDFGNLLVGKSPCSSATSIDSPGRTSSFGSFLRDREFGSATRKDSTSSKKEISLKNDMVSSSSANSISKDDMHSRNGVKPCNQSLLGDYVISDVSSSKNFSSHSGKDCQKSCDKQRSQCSRHPKMDGQPYDKHSNRKDEDKVASMFGDMGFHHQKTSFCGLIVEEKEEADSNNELDDSESRAMMANGVSSKKVEGASEYKIES